jgi:O-antigen ligase
MPSAAFHHRPAFAIILLVLMISPWPLGSNRDWAWPALAILTGLAALTANFGIRNLLSLHHKVVLAAFGFLVCFILFQLHGIPAVIEPITQYFYGTRTDLTKTIMYLGFFYALVQLVDSHDRCRMVVYLIVITGLLQALLGGAQQLMFELLRARGSFPNPNHVAGYLEVALCLAIGAMIADRSSAGDGSSRSIRATIVDIITGPQARLRLVIVIMVIALVMSRSRMGNVAFFSSILITGALAFYHTRTFSRYTAILLVSILAIDAFIISSYFGVEKLAERFRNTTTVANNRIDLQHYNLAIFKDHVWLGTGAGSYEIAFSPYRDADITMRASHTENDYIEFLIELGIIGSLPLLVILIAGIHAQVILLGGLAHPFERGIAFGCLAGTISLLIHSTADVNLQIPANTLLFIVLLAIPIALDQASQQRRGNLS